MTIAIGLAGLVYVGVSIGVFGTLTVPEVIEAGPTAIAVAAQPSLGDLGYWMMTVTALFATAGATNAGLYPAAGLSEELASTGQFPGRHGPHGGRSGERRAADRGCGGVPAGHRLRPVGDRLHRQCGGPDGLHPGVQGHLRIRSDTGANPWLLLAIGTAGISLLVFVFTTLIQEPASIVALIVILLLSIGLDLWWSARSAKVDPQAA